MNDKLRRFLALALLLVVLVGLSFLFGMVLAEATIWRPIPSEQADAFESGGAEGSSRGISGVWEKTLIARFIPPTPFGPLPPSKPRPKGMLTR